MNILKIQNLKQGNQFYKFQRKGRILQKSKRKEGYNSIKSKITTVEKVEDQVITKFNVYIAKEYKYIELTWWTGNTDNVSEYQLYRVSNKSNGAIRLVTSLPANIKRYVDEDITSNTIYTYYLKVLYKSGKSSKFTKVEASY